MDFEEKKYWVGFNVFEGIGPLRFKLLLDFFGSAIVAFNASKNELLSVGLSEKMVDRFLAFRKTFDFDSYFQKLEKLGISILCSVEEQYPRLLNEIEGKPPILYVKIRNSKHEIRNIFDRKAIAVVGTPLRPAVGGTSEGQARKVTIFDRKAIAVVGTRKVTGYGKQVTEMITEGLVASGLVIVSGLARGVDEVAHKTTINNKGLTIAVLGCGLDLVYPPEHKQLAQDIVDSGGAVVSEFPLGMAAVPGNFPARNRIISGLSLGVVVTEAAEDSGSLITASDAAEQGREVFAVPGPITSPLAGGTAALLKKGAKVVSNVNDILEELKITRVMGGLRGVRGMGDLGDLGEEERRIVKFLENENLHIDELVRKTGMESAKVGGMLSMLEIKGIVKNFGEGIYGLSA